MEFYEWRLFFAVVGWVWGADVIVLSLRGSLKFKEKSRKRKIVIALLFVAYVVQFWITSAYFCIGFFRLFVTNDLRLLHIAGPLRFFPMYIGYLVFCAAGYCLLLKLSGADRRRILRGMALLAAILIAVPVLGYIRIEYLTMKHGKEYRGVYAELERARGQEPGMSIVNKVISAGKNEALSYAVSCSYGCSNGSIFDDCGGEPSCGAFRVVV